jgi:hypothetical protein
MLDQLDAQPHLSRNQRKLIAASTIGVMLESSTTSSSVSC